MIPDQYLDFGDNRLRLAIQNQIKRAVLGDTDAFIKGIEYYLDDIPELREEYAYAYIDLLRNMQQALSIRNVDALVSNSTLEALAILYTLEHLVFVGVDTSTTEMKTSLYTNNFNVLYQLQHDGLLSQSKAEVEEIQVKMNKKRKTMVRDGKFAAVRLDVANYTDGGDVQYEIVVPQYMEITHGKRFIFVPVQAYYDTVRFFQSNNQPFKVLYEDYTKGIKRENIVTMTPSVLQQVLPPSLYTTRHTLHESVGFNSVNLKLVFWDLEASIGRTGLRPLKLETLSAVELVDPKTIDTSLLEVGSELNYMFKEIIMSKSIEELKTFTAIDLSTARGSTVYSMLLDFERSSTTKQLYYAMMANPSIFGNVKAFLPAYKEKYKYMVEGVQIELPEVVRARKSVMRDLASKGIIEFLYQNKKGEITKKRMTLMPEALAFTLGFDYVEKFESVGTRVRTLHDKLKAMGEADYITKSALLTKYDLNKDVDLDGYFDESMEYTLMSLQEAIRESYEHNYDLSPTVIRLKSTVAKNKYTFIQGINTEHIQTDITFYDCSILKQQ